MLNDIQTELSTLLQGDPVYIAATVTLFLYVLFMLVSAINAAVDARRRSTAGWTLPATRKKLSDGADGTPREKLILRPSYRRNAFVTIAYLTCWAAIFGLGSHMLSISVILPEHAVLLGILFLIMLLLAWRLLGNTRRIEVHPDKIVDRNPVRFDRTFKMADIHSLEPLKKKFRFGTRLRFDDGRALIVRASFEGYRDFLQHLSASYPQISEVIDRASPARTG